MKNLSKHEHSCTNKDTSEIAPQLGDSTWSKITQKNEFLSPSLLKQINQIGYEGQFGAGIAPLPHWCNKYSSDICIQVGDSTWPKTGRNLNFLVLAY